MICPFCSASPDSAVLTSAHGVALLDGYPLAEGHTLVVPRRHAASVFDLTGDEQADLWRLVARVREQLRAEGVGAVNVGINDGVEAGQTVPHAHIHVIPRRRGDVSDPRGGVRWVLPAAADYWSGGSG